jgi:hypothetical protein
VTTFFGATWRYEEDWILIQRRSTEMLTHSPSPAPLFGVRSAARNNDLKQVKSKKAKGKRWPALQQAVTFCLLPFYFLPFYFCLLTCPP